MKNLKAKVERHPIRKVPKRIFDIQSKSSKRKPEEIAQSTLKKIAGDLKIKSDLSQLRFDKVKESILGNHVLYQQQFLGKPISGAWIRVDIDPEGRVFNIQNDLVPEPVLKKSENVQANKTASFADAGEAIQLTSDQIKQRAIQAVQPAEATKNDIAEAELVYYPENGVPMLAWKVIIKTLNPKDKLKIYFDAISGVVIEKMSLLLYANGTGKVFDPNPVVVLNNTKLTDDSVIPDSAYTQVVLQDLKNTGMLDGPFVNTSTTRNRVKRSNLQFNFKREERAFKEVMVYFHIDRVQRYIQSLGLKVLNRSIAVDIDGAIDDNSFYDVDSKSLVFGIGGVDDAEDAEVIVHEYGHAILDAQVPKFGFGVENRFESKAISEGFGDYLAASFFSDKKPAALKPTFANWDGISRNGAEPPSLRRLDSNKKFPRDFIRQENMEHANGEIWSACLWELRAALGRTAADKLVISHHDMYSKTSNFEDAAKAMIGTDTQINQGRNKKAIEDIFIRRGILPNPQRNNMRAGEPFFRRPEK
jgi:Zn-dependent metalloprotease